MPTWVFSSTHRLIIDMSVSSIAEVRYVIGVVVTKVASVEDVYMFLCHIVTIRCAWVFEKQIKP